MPSSLTLLMAQINPTVGAVESNANKIIQIITSQQSKHDIIVFPELALTGYPLEDLIYRDRLFTQIEDALEKIAASAKHCHVVLGHPSKIEKNIFNTASILFKGHRIREYHKQHLPNYGVFDEKRYFTPGKAIPCLFTVKGHRLAICICEDAWERGPVEDVIKSNADILISINASPFELNKYQQRIDLMQHYAKLGLAIVYVNQIGGQDELVFDGRSFAMDSHGDLVAQAPAFTEHLHTITYQHNQFTSDTAPALNEPALIYQALVCGLRDYVNKNNFNEVLLGLSGGIDSALTLAIAVDALGASQVTAILMPSQYTATMSNEDALTQIKLMGVEHLTLSIEKPFETILSILKPAFSDYAVDTTEENIQARIRGMLLMALSNKTGKMVLSTSNKSETAVGYATLYGDMCGGFSVLKDVYKTTVYTLAAYRNSITPVIPERVITRAPSAELAPNQTDQDSLPDYPTLDAIIRHYMEEKLDMAGIVALGYDKEIVLRIINLITRNEYKRRQAAPGVKITPCAFGRDWRYPITKAYSSV
ncbi:MAG: NAD+ synthase [Legionellaceae bacterium]|nr:NAD+ synthase [Legionellaceae bacterium]